MTPLVVDLRSEYGRPFLGVSEPRLSWRTSSAAAGWFQSAYEIEVDGVPTGWIEDDDSIFRPWPSTPMGSREVHRVRARVRGADGIESEWSESLTVETSLLEDDDWSARWISDPLIVAPEDSSPGVLLRRDFDVSRSDGSMLVAARLHITSAGVHEVELNGRSVGDAVLAPGWTSYPNRIHFDTHDVTASIVRGRNVIGAVVADGWWRGHLGFDGRRNIYGDRIGLIAQLELTWSDGSIDRIVTDGSWKVAHGPIVAADLYDGEFHDARIRVDGWSTATFDASNWRSAEEFEPMVGRLDVPTSPPIRRIEELAVREVLTSPTGAAILDFGQNFVGRVRFTVDGEAGTEVVLRHAEVLDGGSVAMEPLRGAASTDRYILRGDGPESWEPSFTFHGFRYVEVTGWPGPISAEAFTGVVLHSDIERTGTFECSDPLLDRFHENVVWSMRGNFLGVPTDCPQRDERLGWTGDLQVFAPTASFLYDVDGFLTDWLVDLRADQLSDGTVPSVIPVVPGLMLPPAGAAAWGDAATVVPDVVYRCYGDVQLLEDSYESMRAWVDRVAARAGGRLIWDRDFQFGDWLDPSAPNDRPWQGRTDPSIVATAYLARSAELVADAAAALGLGADETFHRDLAARVREAFRREFLTPAGRLMSDSATSYALALSFDLVESADDRERCAANLRRICRENFFTITTGFVGTPLLLSSLAEAGHLREAYAMMLQTECPSWLHAVKMGGTTIWERWDSMLPDGSINGSGMTSFNHYAFGSAAQWLHETVAGLRSDAPGMRSLVVAPRPGGGLRRAGATLRTPYGEASVRWSIDVVAETFELEAVVPANCSARVEIPGDGSDFEVTGGQHRWQRSIERESIEEWTRPIDPWSMLGDGGN